MNDQQTLDKMGTPRRLEIMNNEAQSTYGLLVRSEEKARGIMETVVYALFALSAIISIWQFGMQPSPRPIDTPAPTPYLAPQMSDHQAESRLDRGS
ncbi:MAG: hypothetical protein DME93_13410 [Verrucomicrobia bacterium]|nr:MAG: hypothetical protein DME93_13410 [Verrucomicrobiota bacterium]